MNDREPELIAWRWLDRGHYRTVRVRWSDEGVICDTTLEVDYDVDGASFHYRAGDKMDTTPDCGYPFYDLLIALEDDLRSYEGSFYIPIKPWFYNPAAFEEVANGHV